MELMVKCTVEMFGIPPEITDLRSTDVTVKDGATPSDLVAALREKLPALDGPIISPGRDRLVESFGFYVNGQFYTGDQEVYLKPGDRIVLLALAMGG